MDGQGKEDEELARAQRDGQTLPPMTEMEAAARIFALKDRLAKQPQPPKRLGAASTKVLQEFAEAAKAKGPQLSEIERERQEMANYLAGRKPTTP